MIVAREVNEQGYTPLEAQLLAEREQFAAEMAKVVALLETMKQGQDDVMKLLKP